MALNPSANNPDPADDYIAPRMPVLPLPSAAERAAAREALTNENIPQLLLYRDALILVLDKPTNMAVHAGSGRNDALDRFFSGLRFGLPRDPALGHRLDKETSGCLVLGRHRRALESIGKLFQKGKIEKVYLAVVLGRPTTESGVIAHALQRQSTDKRAFHMKLAEADAHPSRIEPAITEYRLLSSREVAGVITSLIAFFPKTGRTHQIRLHALSLGCPILGDKIYGGAATSMAARLQLHAYGLSIPLYPKRDPLKIIAGLHEDMWVHAREAGASEQVLEGLL